MWKKINFNLWSIVLKEDENNITEYNHGHHDFLHLNLSYDDMPILIDTGRASYSSKDKHGNSYLPEYHNSIRINGLGYKPDILKLYPIDYYKHTHNLKIIEDVNRKRIIISTDGFNRIDKKINFIRQIDLYTDYVSITDISNSMDNHVIENFFHFDKKVRILNEDNLGLLINNKKNFQFTWNNVINTKFKKTYKDDMNYISTKYGETTPAKFLHNAQYFNCHNQVIHKLTVG